MIAIVVIRYIFIHVVLFSCLRVEMIGHFSITVCHWWIDVDPYVNYQGQAFKAWKNTERIRFRVIAAQLSMFTSISLQL